MVWFKLNNLKLVEHRHLYYKYNHSKNHNTGCPIFEKF